MAIMTTETSLGPLWDSPGTSVGLNTGPSYSHNSFDWMDREDR